MSDERCAVMNELFGKMLYESMLKIQNTIEKWVLYLILNTFK